MSRYLIVLLLTVLPALGPVLNAAPDSLLALSEVEGVATFSILGYDPETGEVGGAVQSRVFSVGNGVLWAEADVGVVATQAIVDVSYGPKAWRCSATGSTPDRGRQEASGSPTPTRGRRTGRSRAASSP